jgi:hypothetical protein
VLADGTNRLPEAQAQLTRLRTEKSKSFTNISNVKYMEWYSYKDYFDSAANTDPTYEYTEIVKLQKDLTDAQGAIDTFVVTHTDSGATNGSWTIADGDNACQAAYLDELNKTKNVAAKWLSETKKTTVLDAYKVFNDSYNSYKSKCAANKSIYNGYKSRLDAVKKQITDIGTSTAVTRSGCDTTFNDFNIEIDAWNAALVQSKTDKKAALTLTKADLERWLGYYPTEANDPDCKAATKALSDRDALSISNYVTPYGDPKYVYDGSLTKPAAIAA